ncbi:MAG: cobyric acid synthase [Acidobacteria bacterium]|nr:cobyric acid synthase [Acidobacteriota bacterium]
MTSGILMIQGTGSDAGKSTVVAGLCRLARRRGLSVAPFKPQNMSNNAAVCLDGGEIGRAQALQARAAGRQATVDMNPILLKPQSDRGAQLVVHGRAVGMQDAAAYRTDRGPLLAPVLESFERLRADADLILVEGAGSAAETNLRAGDIANMGFARAVEAPVCLLADIHRGGVIAAVAGTRAVLNPADTALVTSFLINRFRGDPTLFNDGVREIEGRTGWPCRGVIPWLEAAQRLPREDAASLESAAAPVTGERKRSLRIVAPTLSRIANFDDIDPLRAEPGVDFAFIPPGEPIPRDADVVLLPGTKSTLAELAFLRTQGWDHDIISHGRTGGRVLGLCGGYQMLGRAVRDPAGSDGGSGDAAGLGLLDVETVMSAEKTVRPAFGTCVHGSTPITGYEIHMGTTKGPDADARPFAQLASGPDGATDATGRIEGTYLHGLFSNDRFRSAWLERARTGTGSPLVWGHVIESALDELADGIAAAVDVDALFRDAGLE